MIRQLFQQLHRYKFEGDYLNNYDTLIKLIRETVTHLRKSEDRELQLFAIHLLLEVRNHVLGMSYDKRYEMQASSLGKEITNEANDLLILLPQSTQVPLQLLIDNLIIGKNNSKATDAIIRYCTPWSFYLLEFHDKKTLHVLNQVGT